MFLICKTASKLAIGQKNLNMIRRIKLKFNSDKETLKKKTADEVVKDLEDIERYYSKNDYVEAPDKLNLQKVEVEEKSDDELKDLAKSTLDSKYSSKKKSTDESFKSKIDDLIKQNEYLKNSQKDQEDKVNAYYDSSVKETENQALKRGLARSSIVISELSNIEGSRAQELSEILSNLTEQLNEANEKMLSLEEERNNAMNDLDLEYAQSLEEEIEKTKQEYLKRRQEAIEFNNNVDKLEAEYQLKLDNQKTDKQKSLAELESKYGRGYTGYLIHEQQYDYLRSYLESLDKDYAIKLLETNNDFKNILGSQYRKLYEYISSR